MCTRLYYQETLSRYNYILGDTADSQLTDGILLGNHVTNIVNIQILRHESFSIQNLFYYQKIVSGQKIIPSLLITKT